MRSSNQTHFYRCNNCGQRIIYDHGDYAIGMCDMRSGLELYYGDRIEISDIDADSEIRTPGSGIILRVWVDSAGCSLEVLMDNGERGFVRPQFIKKAA